ncbi:MAG: CARDB domain-containing protein [Ardenticatenaceae bacterium]
MNRRKFVGWTTVVMTALLLGGLISMLDSTQAAPTMTSSLVPDITDSSTAEAFVVDRKAKQKKTAISQVRVSNVRDSSLSVSWTTDQPMTGTIRYGTDSSNLNLTAHDDRGADTSDDTHYVTISGLAVTTTYYIDVVSGSTTDNNGGAHYSATTGPILAVPSSDTVYGKVFKADGSTAAEGTIVYLTLQDNNGSGTSGQGALLSSLVKDGFWSVNLGNTRISDLSGYFSYSASGDQLVIEAEGAGDGTDTLTVDTASDDPAADMTLSIPDSADLQVTSVDLPADIYAGYTIPITWTVRNAGSEATNVSAWSDRIYYSSDNTLDTSADTMLATVAHSGTLAAGASYSAITTIPLSGSISGRPYLFVVTDYDDQVEEETKEGNNSTTKQIYVKMTVTSGSSGNNVGLNWPHMTHDSNGTPINVTYYEVWRSSEPYFTPGDVGSTRLVTVTAATSLNRIVGSSRAANTMSYTDVEVMDDANNYYYAVQAMGDSGEQVLDTSNGAGKFNITVYPGWNLLAWPLLPADSSLDGVIGTQLSGTDNPLTADRILAWDAQSQSYSSAWFCSGPCEAWGEPWANHWLANDFSNSPLTLNPDLGFWVQNRSEVTQTLTLVGSLGHEVRLVSMGSNWQLVGSTFPESRTLNQLSLSATGTDSPLTADRILTWDPVTQSYQSSWYCSGPCEAWGPPWANNWLFNDFSSSTVAIQPGHAFWYQNRHDAFMWNNPQPQ